MKTNIAMALKIRGKETQLPGKEHFFIKISQGVEYTRGSCEESLDWIISKALLCPLSLHFISIVNYVDFLLKQ